MKAFIHEDGCLCCSECGSVEFEKVFRAELEDSLVEEIWPEWRYGGLALDTGEAPEQPYDVWVLDEIRCAGCGVVTAEFREIYELTSHGPTDPEQLRPPSN